MKTRKDKMWWKVFIVKDDEEKEMGKVRSKGLAYMFAQDCEKLYTEQGYRVKVK